jgi:hypothetical protein
MDKDMNQTTRKEVLEKLRWRYRNAGAAYKGKLLDQAVQLLGYHRKAAIRALRRSAVERGPPILTGRPIQYEPSRLVPWLRPIWQATDYACGRRLVAMLPEWIPAYEQHERLMPGEVREKLLLASAQVSPATKERIGCARTSAKWRWRRNTIGFNSVLVSRGGCADFGKELPENKTPVQVHGHPIAALGDKV